MRSTWPSDAAIRMVSAPTVTLLSLAAKSCVCSCQITEKPYSSLSHARWCSAKNRSTVTPSVRTISIDSCGHLGIDIQRQTVVGRNYAQAKFVFEFLRKPAWLRLEHLRTEVLEDGDAWPHRFDYRAAAFPRQVIDVGRIAVEQHVYYQHVRLESGVILGQLVEISAARQIRHAQIAVRQEHTVGLHRVMVRTRRPQFDVLDRVRSGARF